MLNPRTKNLIKLLLFILLLAVVGTLSRLSGLGQYIEQERLQQWVKDFGLTGPLVYILIFSAAPALFLPGLPITIAGGVAFGPVWGTVYASIGSTLGAGAAFLISRYFARSQIKELLGPRLQAIDEGVEKRGWIYVAITRLIPLFPYNLLNYAFGLTRIRFYEYLFTSWICMLPATAAYVVFSSSILSVLKGRLSRELFIGALLFLLVSAGPFLFKKFQKKKES
ncbi:MAG: TVP38/TMEM64 family protein [Nitrospiria bacterium]